MKSILFKMSGVAIATLVATTAIQSQASAALTTTGTSVLDSTTGLEWLKLSVTDGQDIPTATTSFGGQGYAAANGGQVSVLLNSFFSQFGLPADPLSPQTGDPSAAISGPQFSAWTGLFGSTFESPLAQIINSGGRFQTAAGVARFGMLQDPFNVAGLGGGSRAIFADDSGPADRVGVFMVRTAVAAAPPTVVPTPALLPGLIGFGLSVFRRKQRQVMAA